MCGNGIRSGLKCCSPTNIRDAYISDNMPNRQLWKMASTRVQAASLLHLRCRCARLRSQRLSWSATELKTLDLDLELVANSNEPTGLSRL